MYVALDLGNRFSSAHSCAQNSFVGAAPKHPILAEYLKLAILNVQSSFYGENVLQNTGPCLFATAIRKYRKDFFTNNTSYPIFESHHYYWRGGDQKGEALIANKCCGFGQNWARLGGTLDVANFIKWHLLLSSIWILGVRE